MRPRFLEACQSFQAAEKACWEILLRELPNGSAISLEQLNAAMDHTLEQLWALLATGAVQEQLKAMEANPSPLPVEQECGLASYLPYFNAGERALELIAGEVEGTYPELASPECARERDELGAAFSRLVQYQLEAICRRCAAAGRCHHRDFRAVAKLPRTPLRTGADCAGLAAAARAHGKRPTQRRRNRALVGTGPAGQDGGTAAVCKSDPSAAVTAGR